MIKTNQSLFRTSPLLCLLVGAQAIGHDQITWLWGGVVWLMISRIYFIPRRMHHFSAETVPSFIGNIYGSLAQGIVAIIHITYFVLLLVKTAQKWNSFGYTDLSPRDGLWITLSCCVAITVFAVFRHTRLSKRIAGGLLLVSCIVLPVLLHLFRPSLDINALFEGGIPRLNILYSNYFPKIDPSIFLLSIFTGHPLLSHEFLQNKDKKQLIRFFKLGSITLAFFVITSSCVLKQIGGEVLIPMEWKSIVFTYRAASALLTAGFLLYMITTHIMYDIVGQLQSRYVYEQSPYVVASFLSGLILAVAYAMPIVVTQQLLCLITPGLVLSQFLFLANMIGLQLRKKNFYIALTGSFFFYSTLLAVGGDSIQPYALGIVMFTIFSLFLAVHYVENSGFVFIKRSWWEKQDIEELALKSSHIKNSFFAFLLFPIKMADYARMGLSRHRTPYKSLTLYFCLIGISGLHLWPIETGSMYTRTAYLFFIMGFALCLGLLIQPVWPNFLARYFALYWYLFLSFYLVSMPMALYIFSSYNVIGLVNLVLSIVLLARFVSLFSFFIIHLLSLVEIFALIRYFAPAALADLLRRPDELYTLFYSYLLACLLGATLIRKSKLELEEAKQKLQALVKKSIAIVSNALNITKSHASIIDLCSHTMDIAEEPDSNEGKNQKVLITMEQASYNTMKENIQKLLNTMNTSRAQLKRVFLPINGTIKTQDSAEYQVGPCIEEAIEIFIKDYEAQKRPSVKIEKDFTFKGSNQALIAALIQLLRNAHEYSHTQGTISLEVKDHKIYIINYGSTIRKENTPHIFNEFFTTSNNNLGLGLFFAKKAMESLGGKIYLEPMRQKNVTCFVLAFR